MAENYNINLDQSDSFSAAGLDPNRPAMTYVDFADQIMRNNRAQQQHEQQVAEASERIKQAQMTTKNKQGVEEAGINPELKDYVSIDEAVALLKANGMKDDLINKFIEEIGDQKYVSRAALQAVILKRGGGASLNMVGSKEGQPQQGEDGKWYRSWIKRTPELGLLMTDRVNDKGQAVFAAEDPEGYATGTQMLSIQDPKLTATTKTANAKETLAGARVLQNKIGNWKDLEKRIDPLTASGTSALALAGKANQRADRVFATLSDPGMTWQKLDAVVTDIAGIFQGGVPPIIGLEHQSVNTWYQKLAKWMEFFQGYQAEGVVPVELQQQLFKLTKEIKDIDNEIIQNQQYITDIGGEDVILQDKERWERLKKAVLNVTESAKEEQAYNRLFNKDKGEPTKGSKTAPAKAGVTTLPSGASYTVEE